MVNADACPTNVDLVISVGARFRQLVRTKAFDFRLRRATIFTGSNRGGATTDTNIRFKPRSDVSVR